MRIANTLSNQSLQGSESPCEASIPASTQDIANAVLNASKYYAINRYWNQENKRSFNISDQVKGALEDSLMLRDINGKTFGASPEKMEELLVGVTMWVPGNNYFGDTQYLTFKENNVVEWGNLILDHSGSNPEWNFMTTTYSVTKDDARRMVVNITPRPFAFHLTKEFTRFGTEWVMNPIGDLSEHPDVKGFKDYSGACD